MSLRNTVNSWLDGLAECVSLSRNLDEDGFWPAALGATSFHLFVPEEENYFVFYTPLVSLAGMEPTARDVFFRFLLQQQVPGSLPPGVRFCLEDEDDVRGFLFLTAQYVANGLDKNDFVRIIQETCALAVNKTAELREELRKSVSTAKISSGGSKQSFNVAQNEQEESLQRMQLLMQRV